MEERIGHKLCLNERENLTVSGVTEVVSFDASAVVLNTNLGTLVVQGRELQLKELCVDGGQVAVDGHIAALTYEETRQSGGWLRRLLE